MALRVPTGHLCRRLARGTPGPVLPQLTSHSRHLATPAPPVTQNAVGSKGPTAMVFLNMGGPSTTDEVGDFLGRLFVRRPRPVDAKGILIPEIVVGCGLDTFGEAPRIPRSLHLRATNAKDQEAIRRNWWWLSHPKVVRVPECRDVQDSGPNFARDGPAQAVRRFPIRRSSNRGDVQQTVRRWVWRREGW